MLRSGHTTQNTSTVFLAPDDADNAEGVAGKTWAEGREVVVRIHSLPKVGDEKSMREYADKTGVSYDWVRNQVERKRQFAAYYRGIPIEVNSTKWGVLLLDSRNPNAEQQITVELISYAHFFGKLLERS